MVLRIEGQFAGNMESLAQFGLGLGVSAAFHPIAYSKILIQIGYEPLEPHVTRSIFGRKVLCYPNVFKYMGHIRKTDGFLGLYRGLFPKLIAGFVGSAITSNIQQKISEPTPQPTPSGEELDGDDESFNQLSKVVKDTSREMISRCAGIIVSQPFHVIMIRSMAQFVGKETQYDTIFSSLKEVYEKDGILGFFAGIVPRLFGEVVTIWLANVLTFIVNTYIIPKTNAQGPGGKDMKSYTNAVCSLMVTQVTYPFILVSNIMVVSKSGLAAGQPPFMPFNQGWTDCWRQLSSQNQLKRGSSLFWRYYRGPTKFMPDGTITPVNQY